MAEVVGFLNKSNENKTSKPFRLLLRENGAIYQECCDLGFQFTTRGGINFHIDIVLLFVCLFY